MATTQADRPSRSAPVARRSPAVFGQAADAGVEAHGVWSAGEVERAVATPDGAEGDRITDAFMKVVCIAPSGRSGFAVRGRGGRGAAWTRCADRPGRGQGRRHRRAGRAGPRRVPGGLRAPRGGTLLDLLGATAFNGLAHVEGQRRARRPAGPARGRAGGQPRRLAALCRRPPARLRRRGHEQASAAADPGRRGPPGGPRHRAARRWPAPSPPGTRWHRAATPTALTPRTSSWRAAAPKTRKSCARRWSAAST